MFKTDFIYFQVMRGSLTDREKFKSWIENRNID